MGGGGAQVVSSHIGLRTPWDRKILELNHSLFRESREKNTFAEPTPVFITPGTTFVPRFDFITVVLCETIKRWFTSPFRVQPILERLVDKRPLLVIKKAKHQHKTDQQIEAVEISLLLHKSSNS